jgi:hypothetical protein
LASPSTRGRRTPIAAPAGASTLDRRPAGCHDGIHDLAVARAAAEHAAQRVLDLGSVGCRRLLQQLVRGHQHAGRADAALRRAKSDERFLQP